jgi:hypothetical protein
MPDGDEQGNAIADATLGNLLTEPHEHQGTRSHEDDRCDKEPSLTHDDDRAVLIDVVAGEEAGPDSPTRG